MIYVTKFRANDLNPSKGKQIEFNIGVIRSLFQFTSDQESAEFKCYSLADPSIKRTIKASFTKSPARGDYKIYQNADESMDLKDFFLDVLNSQKVIIRTIIMQSAKQRLINMICTIFLSH